jgi:hypothetical protein
MGVSRVGVPKVSVPRGDNGIKVAYAETTPSTSIATSGIQSGTVSSSPDRLDGAVTLEKLANMILETIDAIRHNR